MARRELQEINAGSMADIAFLLLIFFLVTTTMDQDKGIMRILPPIVDEEDVTDETVKQRNVYVVLVNSANQLLVENQPMDISDLKDGALEFLTNSGVFAEEYTDPDLTVREWVNEVSIRQDLARALKRAEEDEENAADHENAAKKHQAKLDAIELFGKYRELGKAAVISLQNDNNTSYDTYLQVQNELTSAINQLRDDLLAGKIDGSKGINYGKTYLELDDKVDVELKLIRAVRQVFPQRISEAEPKKTS